jgi:hypothetical protein
MYWKNYILVFCFGKNIMLAFYLYAPVGQNWILAFYLHAEKLLNAIYVKNCLFIWMVMFYIFARTLKDKGKLRHKLGAFTFHSVRLVIGFRF